MIKIKPILKYIGGKQRELKKFEEFIPKEYNTYYEPFVGGGSVFFHLKPKNAVISDINNDLINFYKHIKTKYDDFIEEISHLSGLFRLADDTQKSNMYYHIRDMYNNKVPKIYSDAVIYYFINKTAYSGLVRVNSKGEFNVPFGKYKKVEYKDIVTKEHSDLLRNTVVKCCDYNDIFDIAAKGDFMFLDPPYDEVFCNYGNVENFTRKDHLKLFERFTSTECKCLMVIGRTDFTETLYEDYIIDIYDKKYAVNSKSRYVTDTSYLVCTNYYI